MKKFFIALIVSAGALFVYTAPVAADTNNFNITNFKVEMELGRDDEGRSTLRTTEKITAKFPDFDQNHGLERVFVKKYEDRSTSFKLESVTDVDGNEQKYSWSDDAIRIGDADKYVYGEQAYVITYTQRDVTRFFEDTGRDEFYWDVIGLNWRVPIERAVVEVKISDDLIKSLTDEAACYQGYEGSKTGCELLKTNAGYEISVGNLAKENGVTLAIGFDDGTFQPYKKSLADKVFEAWTWSQIVLVFVGLGMIIWAVVKRVTGASRKKEWGTIVPEYIPPKDTSVLTAARTGGYQNSIMTAQLLDLAVRRYIRLYEIKKAELFSAAEYEIKIIKDISNLKPEEQRLLNNMFAPETPVVGAKLNLKSLVNNHEYFSRTLKDDRKLDELIRGDYGLQKKDDALAKWIRRMAIILSIAAVLLVSPVLLVAALVVALISIEVFSFTDKGLALKVYLEGLKEYISVAEEERIRLLQSPEGSQKVASIAGGTDAKQLIKLYERLLPYAVIFGQEKQWNKQIGQYYEAAGVQPDWYASQSAFSAAAFSSAMSDFASSSGAVSSASSSAGGSDGGGGAGGGGGGGGGGGW